ncbi:HAD-IC family P-type ATPase [Trueperella sp. LYQ143]|uniref:HAD-IC family P-type ATPase n=1 Tax=unclassified Trueperella TaxID=2630174 RepID=UPI0039834E45
MSQTDHTHTDMTAPTQPHDGRVSGLTTEQVEQRRAAGRANELPPRTGKTVRQIVQQNVFTRINAILAVLLVMVLSTGSWINAAFGLLIVVNSAIGIIQELRAKHTLESLSIIGEEHPRVWRDGTVVEVKQEDLVLDDLVELAAGNQIVVDGEVATSDYLSVDESNLTGESDPVAKKAGDTVMSGSFVVSGTGSYVVTKVGAQSYAAKLAQEASRFTLARSQLQAGIDSILRYVTWVLIPVGIVTVISQMRSGVSRWQSMILDITGALVPMVPEGLVLITSTAFALGVIRLGRRQCLVQELPAIEGLARVDVVCADKTGTLTENTLEFAELVIAEDARMDRDAATGALAQLLATDPAPNATAQTAMEQFPLTQQPWPVVARQPFTSAKKWSGATFAEGTVTIVGSSGAGTAQAGSAGSTPCSWVMGAPDVLAQSHPLGQQAEEIGATGKRVIVFGWCETPVDQENAPGQVHPVGLLVFEQRIRPDAADTLEYFARQDVDVKVISGDNATSVAAVTNRLGIDAGQAVDARHIEDSEFDEVITSNRTFGRVRPDQKQAMVKALQKAGHTVAMTGDGVNDVLALKNADIGVAMGSGSAATRAVAKIVLLDNRFATLPYVVGEGRRVIGNIERVANLFLTKTIYSAILAILITGASVPFPFVPIHVTITGWFTIGIPAFFLALPPNNNRAKSHFVRRVLHFAVPAGVIVGVTAVVAYLVVSGGHVPDHHVQESTAALAALIIPSSWVLCCIARPLSPWKLALIILPLVGYGVIFTWSVTQRMFSLDSSNVQMMIVASVIGVVGALGVEGVWWWNRMRSEDPTPLWKPEPFFDSEVTHSEERSSAK